MTTGATGQLGLALPVQGELSGTWGDTVNNGITQYTNIAIAGTLTLTGDGAVTLANTTGDASASNITSTLAGAGTVTAQFAIVKVSGTTTTKVVTGPSYSKTYVVDNASSFAVTFKASGQTGVSIAAAEKVTVVFNGTDYIKLAGTIANAAGSNTQIQFNNGGLFGASANLTWDGTYLTAGSIKNSSLTSGRVPFAGAAGLMSDSANLTWNGTSLSATQIDITAQGPLRLQDTTGGEYVGLRSPATLGASYTLTFPADDGTSGQALITDGSGGLSWSTAASGDVYGPASATNNGIALFDGTTGKIIKDSASVSGLIQGITIGRGAGAVATNTAVGASALAANTTGSFNTAVGNTALLNNTTGDSNIAIGFAASEANTIGGSNIAIGYAALASNTTGNTNVAIGRQALVSNTTASNNTAVGYQAAYTNTTGTGLVAVGESALRSNTTGYNNIGIGQAALYANTTGISNTSVGETSLRLNTTGSNNTALGDSALYSNTTASNNTAVGYQAGYSNSTGTSSAFFGYQAGYSSGGSNNTALGTSAMLFTSSGGQNTAVGAAALLSNTTASNNTAVGYQSLYSNTTATGNTALGFQARYGSDTESSNTTAIGYQAMLLASATSANATDSVAIGYRSMWTFNATTANLSLNTAVGTNSLGFYNKVTGLGSTNVAIGLQAMELYSNTTGDVVDNVAVGVNALRMYANTTQATSYNTAVGRDALVVNQGSNNTAVGFEAGYKTTTGASNSFFGYQAGHELLTGATNTFIGFASGYLMTTGSKNTILGGYNGNQGGLDIRTADNYIVLSDGDGNPKLQIDNTSGGNIFWLGERLENSSSNNMVINNGGSIRINIDCDNNNTGESFTVGTNQRSIDSNNKLFEVLESGTVVLPFGQIQFPATQNASSNANTLDDYEEGTFNPTINCTTNSGTVVYSYQYGYYVKVGQLVWYYFDLNITSYSGASGTPYITMPFVNANLTQNYSSFVPWDVYQNFTGTNLQACGYLNVNGTEMYLLKRLGTSSEVGGAININTTGRISGVITYRAKD
jgi:hypothetical protein